MRRALLAALLVLSRRLLRSRPAHPSRDSAGGRAAGRRAAAAPRRVASRLAPGPVLLAARRHPLEAGRARLPEGRERLLRGDGGALRAAHGEARRRADRPRDAGRQRRSPSPTRGYLYSTRYETGKEYPIRVRTPVGGGAEQILVDGNVESRGHALLLARTASSSAPEQELARLHRGHRRPLPEHPAHPRDRERARAPRPDPRRPAPGSPGRRTTGRSSTSRTTR